MPAQPAKAEPTQLPTPPPRDEAAASRHYRDVIDDLIDLGAGLARLLADQAHAVAAADRVTEAPSAATPPNTTPQEATPTNLTATPAQPPAQIAAIAAAFDRVARGVRRSILLARHIAATPVPTAADPAGRRTVARGQIIRNVEDAIARTARGKDAGTLHAELLDRLDAPDLELALAHRPIADIVADICRDLGLDNCLGARPWKRRTPTDVERLVARAAAGPGDPRLPVARADPPPLIRPRPPDPAADIAKILRYAAPRPPDD